MTHKILISNEAHKAIISAAELPFKETGKKLANGMWEIPLSEDNLMRLAKEMFSGENLSDVIIRLTTKGVRQ